MRMTRSKWFLPLLSVGFGAIVLVAEWIGGHPGSGLVSLATGVALGGLVLLGGRSETIRGLRGDGRDERFRKIDIHATAVAGLAVLVTTITASIVQLARGHQPGPYGWITAIGCGSYIAAVVVFRVRG
jgi:hypothetical protein